MFCGWASYESRLQVIGEGASGKYYELSPGPWGDFNPYGSLGRRHYDSFAAHGTRLGLNALKHTTHEPITKIYVVEENHSKKFNLPDEMYENVYGEPKEMKKYYHVRVGMTPEGQVFARQDCWLGCQSGLCLGNNPRLQADIRRTKPYYMLGTSSRPRSPSVPSESHDSEREDAASTPLGN
jgi:hypothetical protein